MKCPQIHYTHITLRLAFTVTAILNFIPQQHHLFHSSSHLKNMLLIQLPALFSGSGWTDMAENFQSRLNLSISMLPVFIITQPRNNSNQRMHPPRLRDNARLRDKRPSIDIALARSFACSLATIHRRTPSLSPGQYLQWSKVSKIAQ